MSYLLIYVRQSGLDTTDNSIYCAADKFDIDGVTDFDPWRRRAIDFSLERVGD